MSFGAGFLRTRMGKENVLINRLSPYILLVLVTFCVCSSPARARGNESPLQSEEAFLAQLGSRAEPAAPGVYRIQVSPQETIEVAFGQRGLDYDRARLQEELTALRAQLRQSPADRELRQNLRRKIAEHVSALAALWEGDSTLRQGGGSPQNKAAVTGTVCGDYFDFSLDGGYTSTLLGGAAWGQASISVSPVQVGPPPPTIPAHRAYSAVQTLDESNNTFSDVNTQLVPEGSGATAQSYTSVGCGISFECPAWISYNWVNAYGCTDGYRRIYRTKVNPNG
jgi:CubicO group peptidase (beta-lactamase class C family)